MRWPWAHLLEEAREEVATATRAHEITRNDREHAQNVVNQLEQIRRENNLAPRMDAAFKARKVRKQA